MKKELYEKIIYRIVSNEAPIELLEILSKKIPNLTAVNEDYSLGGVMITFRDPNQKVSEDRIILGSDTFGLIGEECKLCGFVLYISREDYSIEALECFTYEGDWSISDETNLSIISS